MGDRRAVYRFLMGKPEGRRHLGDASIDGRIILSCISRKWDVGTWTGLMWLRMGTRWRALVTAVINLRVP